MRTTRHILAAVVLGAAMPMLMGAAAPTTPATATALPGRRTADAPQCWSRCVSCRDRCSKKSGSDRSDCEDNCIDANATCCEANGGKGTYKMCGCT